MDLFAFAERYPLAPALGVTETSRAAARIIRPTHNALQNMVLREIEREPGTWKEVSDRLQMDSRSIQPRFSELKELGLIVGTGHKRDRCEVYRIKGSSHADN